VATSHEQADDATREISNEIKEKTGSPRLTRT
jgi:hypothetical protein